MNTTPDTYYDLFFAYTVVWGLIAAFVLRMMKGQAAVAAELRSLRQDGSK